MDMSATTVPVLFEQNLEKNVLPKEGVIGPHRVFKRLNNRYDIYPLDYILLALRKAMRFLFIHQIVHNG